MDERTPRGGGALAPKRAPAGTGENDDKARNVQRAERLRLFGEQLAELRARKGFTQSDLAGRVRGAQSTVSRWELGEVLPPREVVLELEEELDLEPGTLATMLGYAPPGRPEAVAEPAMSVEQMLLSDPNLDDVGRQAVLAVYRAFKRKRPGRSGR